MSQYLKTYKRFETLGLRSWSSPKNSDRPLGLSVKQRVYDRFFIVSTTKIIQKVKENSAFITQHQFDKHLLSHLGLQCVPNDSKDKSIQTKTKKKTYTESPALAYF